jgi:hypothetical protein
MPLALFTFNALSFVGLALGSYRFALVVTPLRQSGRHRKILVLHWSHFEQYHWIVAMLTQQLGLKSYFGNHE